jgi:hypothetical protein
MRAYLHQLRLVRLRGAGCARSRLKQLIQQELHPIKGLLQGKLQLRGHLYRVEVATSDHGPGRTAGQMETTFVDEITISDGGT